MGRVLTGAGFLFRGLGIVLSRPKLFGLGMVPPLVTSVLMVVGLVVLGLNLDSIVGALTGFTQQWGTAGTVVRAIIGVVVFLAAILVMVLTFTTITLTLGDPIYQRISRRVDAELGPLPPEPDEATGAMIARSLSQAVATVGLSVLAAVGCFLVGLVPAAGAALAAVASALTGGRLMVREITGPAFERRGLLQTADRRPVLKGNGALALGFGVPTFWLLSIPGVAVLVLPAAVAGATLLVRRMLGEGTSPDPREH
ncbi:EI24 domain-containing protein [Granulicoccus sp. GXG6511]|uniref:EI24 domain-containing protein n=1 Tax=Granulicoccus sp. GXG6511 TaxID=3381351 RepID=UPI003D7F16BC